MKKCPLYPSDSEMKVEVVGEWIFITEKNVQELDPGEIVLDGGKFQGSAEKLSASANGVNVGWKRRPLEMHTKHEVRTELCAQIGIGTLGKGSQACGVDVTHEIPEFLLP